MREGYTDQNGTEHDLAETLAEYEGLSEYLEDGARAGTGMDARNEQTHDSFDRAYKAKLRVILDGLIEQFKFQKDNGRNIYEYLITMWESRADRLNGRARKRHRSREEGSCRLSKESLRSLYEDYVWGANSNFRKWFSFVYGTETVPRWMFVNNRNTTVKNTRGSSDKTSVDEILMKQMLTEISLWLLIWGESNNLRVMPEVLCFIFDMMMTECQLFNRGRSKFNEDKSPRFLSHIVNPIYDFYQFQITWNRNNDHSHIIGYDDINQCFWTLKSIKEFRLKDGSLFVDLPSELKYYKFNEIEWSKSLRKTYYESRTWFHLITNFHRIWSIHLSTFWYFSILSLKPLFTRYYVQTLDNEPQLFVLFSILSLAGTWSSLITLMALIGELIFVPKSSNLRTPMKSRFVAVTMILLANVMPPIAYITLPKKILSERALTISSLISLLFSMLTCLHFSLVPLSNCDFGLQFGSFKSSNGNPFTQNWSKLNSKESNLSSIGLWTAIWFSKFFESYYFLCTSIKDPARDLFLSHLNCSGIDSILHSSLCRYWTKSLLMLLIITNFVLFLLDTYLWYIIYNTMFSLIRSIYIGMTKLTPWKNVYINLTNKMKTKLLPLDEEWDTSMISKIWNEIIYSMYHDNLINSEHVERLIFHKTNDNNLLKPSLLSSSDDHFFRTKLFKKSKEVRRRLSFFAQSLHCPLPNPGSIENMAMFTVLIPHYNEKILLSLKDIIKGETDNSNITLLEYLKLIYPTEWTSYIEETNSMMKLKSGVQDEHDQEEHYFGSNDEILTINDPNGNREVHLNVDSMNAFKFAGFKLDIPEQTIRTRIWASLRTQTLYRTVSGFMKYLDAIKLLHQVETSKRYPEDEMKTNLKHNCANNDSDTNSDDNRPTKNRHDISMKMASHKFQMVCSMQRMNEFDENEKMNRNILLTEFPSLKVAYIDSNIDTLTGNTVYYSCLIDGYCNIDSNGDYIPKYRIKLSGNPILGNGKSDNQNHAIIFTRGEYIQLVDANQDNYLEECLKIKNVLKEFEDEDSNQSPIAIVGAREYIFSENNGVLGDIAAGKEKVFGTFFARTLGYINSKLHYGHPDFINSIYVTTRGGVSKTQRGLHLNEDIYVGMNILMRGGRIKHCEYYQCGKGRDLSFNSILNFTTKIGSGMGEQLLSREYFYLGTSLPMDKFLTFFYAHAGFHLNNVLIYLSLCLFLIIILNLAVMIDSSVLCVFSVNFKHTDPWEPESCLQLFPVLLWLRRSTFIVLLISMVSFIPLFLQHLNDNGLISAAKRLSKQMISGAVFFELFSCKMASYAMITDIRYGDAKYLSTTRGLSFERIPFVILFTKFANETIYFAGVAFLILMYASIVMWDISLLYFWFLFTSLLLSPFIFNPSQFHWIEFLMDYKKTIDWFFKWKRTNSWLKYNRKQKFSLASVNLEEGDTWLYVVTTNLWSHVIPQFIMTTFIVVPFIISNINNVGSLKIDVGLRLLIVIGINLFINALILLVLFIISTIHGVVVFQNKQRWFYGVTSKVAAIMGIISASVSFLSLSFLQRWESKSIILGGLASLMIQKLIYQIIFGVIIPFDWNNEKRNESWWTGKWLRRNHTVISPILEFFQKMLEMTSFSIDFILAHFILLLHLPILLIPNIDTIHSLMLFWRKADIDARPIKFRKKTKMRKIVRVYSIIFIITVGLLLTILLIPSILDHYTVMGPNTVPDSFERFMQPSSGIGLESELGLTAYRRMMKSFFHKPKFS